MFSAVPSLQARDLFKMEGVLTERQRGRYSGCQDTRLPGAVLEPAAWSIRQDDPRQWAFFMPFPPWRGLSYGF